MSDWIEAHKGTSNLAYAFVVQIVVVAMAFGRLFWRVQQLEKMAEKIFEKLDDISKTTNHTAGVVEQMNKGKGK